MDFETIGSTYHIFQQLDDLFQFIQQQQKQCQYQNVYGFLVFQVIFSIFLFLFHSQFDTSIINEELPNSTWEWDAILHWQAAPIFCCCIAVLRGLCVYVHCKRHRENKDHNLNLNRLSISVLVY